MRKRARRRAGILVHPTALPGPPEAGDIGEASRTFIDLLVRAGQSVWQLLPVGPPGFGDSPYASHSSFAGSPDLVALDALGDAFTPGVEGTASPTSIDVDHARNHERRDRALRGAFARRREADAPLVASFVAHEGAWLRDWALYSAFKKERGGAPWTAWEPALRDREPAALARESDRLADEVAFAEWTQCHFDLQWRTLRAYARAAGVALIGDLPMYVAHDSADVWANRSLFDLDALGMPVNVAGVPPDYFSREGQRWGNPLYVWDEHRRTGFSYWCARVEKALERFDEVRLDHFVGLVRAWEIPAHEATAERGRFVEVPGETLLSTLEERFGVLPFVAEDLGIVPREARRLRRAHGFPGMRILQFAFGDDSRADEFLPHAYPRRTFVYTGTHDNDTAVGWYRDDGSGRASPRSPERIADERRKLHRYLSDPGEAEPSRPFDPAEALVRLAYASVADTVIVPVQDVLGEDGSRRTNVPGTSFGNWRYRMPAGAISEADCRRLHELAETYGRLRPASREPSRKRKERTA